MQTKLLVNGELAAGAAAKLAVFDPMADEDGPSVRCHAASPGWIMTEMAADGSSPAKDPQCALNVTVARHASGRLGRPASMTSAVACPLDRLAVFITGQCFVIDGWLTSASPIRPGLF